MYNIFNLLSAETVNTPMSITKVVESIITAITSFIKGIGTSISGLFDSLFSNGSGELSTFAIVALCFIGLSLAMGLVMLVIKMIKR